MNINILHEWASCLNIAQALENDGRGVSCIRGTVADLLRGDLEGAKQGIRTDWDKIRNYPPIARFIKKNIMFGEKYLGYTDEHGEWQE